MALCLISFKPHEVWLKFLNDFIHYDIYIIIYDNDEDYNKKYKNQFTKLKFIQIENYICEQNGFVDMNYTIKKNVTGWEKAIYYFSNNNKYDNIWFIEDDVFFYDENTIKNIDFKYPRSDLLTNKYCSNNKKWIHWDKIVINFTPPYYRAMVCATRVSSKILFYINEYVNDNRKLFFLEALFPSIAMKYNLIYDTPLELSNIYWKREFNYDDFDKERLYHPMKQLSLHVHLRKKLTT